MRLGKGDLELYPQQKVGIWLDFITELGYNFSIALSFPSYNYGKYVERKKNWIYMKIQMYGR